MEEQPLICVKIERSFVEFELEMPENNENILNLTDVPVSVGVKRGTRTVNETREVESTISNQGMTLIEWIRHFGSLTMYFDVDFFVGLIEFDIQTFHDTLPKVRCLSITCLIDQPDENDILEAQNLLRPFLPDVRHLQLNSVPLSENLSLQHIGMANLKVLSFEYLSNVRFVDLCTCNAESIIIGKKGDQMSLVDLNRFFKLWITGSNPRLEELFIEWDTETIPDWNILLKGLKAEIDDDEDEEGTKYFTIQNNRDISAEIKIHHSEDTASVRFEII
ncbi:hypothetical protein B9Z55_026510 [Caenorhabditis nigoni]|uniref:Sdz-33 F-box domain-containing protein n=1 Tax=Caenorhabditis nigoni TaxID=1611254 RepID=A0A2G5T3M9_9PELO|nr:hypothetical protein B9Z55_026510 [Caenorhabditis nigoni]